MPDQPTFVVNDRRKFTSEGELRQENASAAAPASTPARAPAPESPGGPAAAPLSFPQATATQAPEQDALNISTPALEQLADLPESGIFDQQLESQSSTALPSSPGKSQSETALLPEQDDPLYDGDEPLPPAPTAEENEQALRAYEATVDRLDTAMRAADPGGERMPPMSFERLTQSLYTQALMLLGGGTQPGEQPRVDILGARQTIDMLAIVAEKAKGNLNASEEKLIESALFDLRMGFLEITQALARQAAQRQPAGPGSGIFPAGGSFSGTGAGPRIVR